MIAVHRIDDAFSPGECAALSALAAALPAQEAGLVGGASDPGLRTAELVWLDDIADAGWAMDRIMDLVRRANRTIFGFDLTDFAESPQIARYGAERQGHFDWHADVGDGPVAARRKLTLVVQLSDADAYAGGDLQVWPSRRPVTAARAQGAAMLFPSYLLHRVTPVTGGERRSLTSWAHGPGFR